MASVNDYPIGQVQELIQKIANSGRMRDGSVAQHLEKELTLDEARMIWAAASWLDFYDEWGVGIEMTRTSLRECKRMLERKKNEVKVDQRMILNTQEIRAMIDAALHLDRLAIMKEEDRRSARRSGGRKK